MENDLRDRLREFKRKSDGFTEDFSMARNEALSGLQGKIYKAISEVAKERNYDLVLSENVLYMNEQVDLTDEVLKRLKKMGAGAVILKQEYAAQCPVTALVSDNPYLAYAKAAQLLFPRSTGGGLRGENVVIGASSRVAVSADIGPNVIVGNRVEIGEGVVIGAGCVISDDCVIGAFTEIQPRVSILGGAEIGQHCLIHSGAVVGSDGFGFANEAGRWVKIPQVGKVVIGNHVDVGANTTVDRGAIEDTIIHDGVKLDNQIHIAHNVEIGEHTIMAGGVKIAGSTKIGRYCLFGGNVGV
ncbi:unnamed protein product, partial [Cyprideis torosa]